MPEEPRQFSDHHRDALFDGENYGLTRALPPTEGGSFAEKAAEPLVARDTAAKRRNLTPAPAPRRTLAEKYRDDILREMESPEPFCDRGSHCPAGEEEMALMTRCATLRLLVHRALGVPMRPLSAGQLLANERLLAGARGPDHSTDAARGRAHMIVARAMCAPVAPLFTGECPACEAPDEQSKHHPRCAYGE